MDSSPLLIFWDIEVQEPRFDRTRRGTGTCDVEVVSCSFVGSEMLVKCLWMEFHTKLFNTQQNLYCHLLCQ